MTGSYNTLAFLRIGYILVELWWCIRAVIIRIFWCTHFLDTARVVRVGVRTPRCLLHTRDASSRAWQSSTATHHRPHGKPQGLGCCMSGRLTAKAEMLRRVTQDNLGCNECAMFSRFHFQKCLPFLIYGLLFGFP